MVMKNAESRSLWTRITEDVTVEGRGVVLWNPIAATPHSRLGLYSDDRFPGRCILAPNAQEPYRDLADLPLGTLTGFIRDAQFAMRAIQCATGAARVNLAILGNRDPFVHAHLIPRFPKREAKPDCSPWDDPRIRRNLVPSEQQRLVLLIWAKLLEVDSRHAVPRSLPVSRGQSLPGLDYEALGIVGFA